ncbi:MAG: ABC transporter permease [Caldilineaceae bacterium]|nr:ABC transporter permease [Caldilineaceae bacterium]
MLNFIISRLLQGALVIFLISVVTFIMLRLMPGDPVMLLLGEGAIQITEEQITAIRAKWGLDKSYPEQYFVWAGNLLRGDLGESLIRRGVPVRQMIFEALPVTGRLSILAVLVALALAIPAGIVAAVKRNSIFDYLLTIGATAGVALPNFWFGLMGIIVFALLLRWLPPFGLTTWKGYILPVAVLATGEMAILARVMRAATIEVLSQDYVRTATAKGLAQPTVVLRHAVRNALLPVVSVVGFRMAFLFSGTIVIETIFALPGIGRLFVDSVFRLDYQVVQSIVVLLGALVVLANLVTDLVYAVVDPRLRVR